MEHQNRIRDMIMEELDLSREVEDEEIQNLIDARIIQCSKETYISIENISLARFLLPCPRVMETRALPPVPIMKPMEPNIMQRGIMRLMAAKGVLPAKFETKIPSTTP